MPEYTEFVASSCTSYTKPFYLRVPNDQVVIILWPVLDAPYQLESLLHPWVVDHDHPESEPEARDPASDDNSSLARVVVQSVTMSINGASPLWIMKRTSSLLSVGMRVILADAAWPEHRYNPAKIVGIHALEQDWVEFALRVCPEDAVAFGEQMIMVAAPINTVSLASVVAEAYDLLVVKQLADIWRDAYINRYTQNIQNVDSLD
ncbi:hypothetical protein EIP86_005222 [Pleurotus ostreatoroseus]|nr:hypothetical protein EIP86_005222 [Pleurotus ostreatoroseus]